MNQARHQKMDDFVDKAQPPTPMNFIAHLQAHCGLVYIAENVVPWRNPWISAKPRLHVHRTLCSAGETHSLEKGAMQVSWSEENELLSRVHQHWWKYHLPDLKLAWLGSTQPRQSWIFLVLSLFKGLLASGFNLFLLLCFLLLSCNIIILENWWKSISFCLSKLELIYLEIPFFLYIQIEPCIL